MTAFQYLVAATTVWSGASYLWTKDAVKILGTRSHAEKMQILTRGRMIIGISFLACGGIALALERSQ
jgi:cardiolipin synthase